MARNRNTSISKHSFNLRQRLPFRFNHVEKTNNCRYGGAAAEEKVGTRGTLSKQNRTDKGDKEIADPIEAYQTKLGQQRDICNIALYMTMTNRMLG